MNAGEHSVVSHRSPRPVVSVAIVGAGLVGTTTAHALLVSGVASEIVLLLPATSQSQEYRHLIRCDLGVGDCQSSVRLHNGALGIQQRQKVCLSAGI